MDGYQCTYKNHRIFYNGNYGGWYCLNHIHQKSIPYQTEHELKEAIRNDSLEFAKRIQTNYECNLFRG